MAKEIQGFIDERNVEYPNSYWRVASINISVVDRAVGITFYGYKDAPARLAGAQPIGSKFYQIGPDKFDALYSKEVALTANLAMIAYGVAAETKDVITDEKTPPKRFFDGAKDV